MQKYVWIGIAGSFFLFLIILLSIGLSNGEKLSFEEQLFYEHSTQEQPLASCVKFHQNVISNVEIYRDFVDACDYDLDSRFDADYFSETVLVLMFFEGSSSDAPKAFYDYLFMNDGHEVIQVRYHHSLFGTTKDQTWRLYFVEMRKDQIHSGDVVFQ